MKPSFTLGIEEEYQTIDPETLDLRSHINTELIAQGKMRLKEKVKAEMHQSVIEVGTGICRTIGEARSDVADLRRQTIRLAREHGLLLAAGATHPFADWRVQDIYPDERYLQVVEDMQTVARSNLIFGLHVHVGVEDREASIHLMNQMRYFLPHLLALSTNSPFWLGMNTGLKSYRCKVFDKFPRTNIPDTFTGWADFEQLVNLLIRTNCIDNAKRIWWDIRPHPLFSTLEVRICDLPMRVDETLAIAALIQATVAKLYKLHSRNQGFRLYSRAADHGEQVAGCPLRARWHDDRLRPREGAARARADSRVPRLRGRRARRTGVPERGRVHPDHPRPRHRRRPPAAGLRRDQRPEESGAIHGGRDRGGTVTGMVAIDPELLPGARNAIRVCLAVQPDERVTVITDRACAAIAASLVHEIEQVGAPHRAFVLEEVAARPLTALPAVIADEMERSQVSIFAVQVQANELRSRMEMTDIVNRRRMRHAHMVNINRQIMLEGMRADYHKVDRLSSKVLRLVQSAREIRATTPAGSDFRAALNPAYRWVKTSGLISPDKWGNLPGGEVFTTPGEVNGTFVIDGVVGDYLCDRFGSLEATPLTVRVKENVLVEAYSENRELEAAFWAYTHTDENSDRVGEFAIGTNIELTHVIGHILQDEKFPGIHIAFGNPYGAHTGADWYSSTHIDVVGTRFDIWVDEQQIMRDGRFLIAA